MMIDSGITGYESQPLYKRVQDGTRINRHRQLSVAHIMQPVLRLGFGPKSQNQIEENIAEFTYNNARKLNEFVTEYSPDKDETAHLARKMAKDTLESTIGHDLAMNKIDDMTEKLALHLVQWSSGIPGKAKLKKQIKEIVQDLMRLAPNLDERIAAKRRPSYTQIQDNTFNIKYEQSRSQSWQVKRLINAQTLTRTNINKQIMALLPPVIIDLLDERPTLKTLSRLESARQMRRTRERHPYMIRELGNISCAKTIINKHGRKIISWGTRDGIERYHNAKFDSNERKTAKYVSPQGLDIRANGTKDRRVKGIVTPYGLGYGPYASPEDFDMRVFADAAYIKRQRMFWEHSLEILSKWWHGQNETGVQRAIQNHWLLYHIVNNDIAMHVLFDNLSLECERKFLTARIKQQIVYNDFDDTHDIAHPYDSAELDDIIRDIIEKYGTDSGLGLLGHIYKTQSGRDIVVIMDTGRHGGSCIHVDRVPQSHPFTKKDAKEAVAELAKFADDFPKVVEKYKLEAFAISPDIMNERVGELVLESALALKCNSDGMPRQPALGEVYVGSESELRVYMDAWKMVCAAWAKNRMKVRFTGLIGG